MHPFGSSIAWGRKEIVGGQLWLDQKLSNEAVFILRIVPCFGGNNEKQVALAHLILLCHSSRWVVRAPAGCNCLHCNGSTQQLVMRLKLWSNFSCVKDLMFSHFTAETGVTPLSHLRMESPFLQALWVDLFWSDDLKMIWSLLIVISLCFWRKYQSSSVYPSSYETCGCFILSAAQQAFAKHKHTSEEMGIPKVLLAY